MVNGPDAIFVKRHHGPSSYHDEVFNDDEHVLRTLTKILDDATLSHRREVDLRRLVAGCLRMAPDVAIVGEVRDREALPLLLTLSSGVKGFTTIHAGSARQALTRLRFICQLADTATALPLSALSALVSEAVDLVVHCTRVGSAVRVSEIVAVEELQTGRDAVAFTLTDLFTRARRDEPLQWTGNLPVRAGRFL